mmetsp:Transcript_95840/g.228272  ORF Transcript_95840/g.228272 Transcript_95840/m.228272 type:complete len:579 (+) Transcript_95840:779-2515(+)
MDGTLVEAACEDCPASIGPAGHSKGATAARKAVGLPGVVAPVCGHLLADQPRHARHLPRLQAVVRLGELWDVIVDIHEGHKGGTPPHHGEQHRVEEEGTPWLEPGTVTHTLVVLLLVRVRVLVVVLGRKGRRPHARSRGMLLILIILRCKICRIRNQRPCQHRRDLVLGVLGPQGLAGTGHQSGGQLVLGAGSHTVAAWLSVPPPLPPLAGVLRPAIDVHIEHRPEGPRQHRAGLVLFAVEDVQVVEEPAALQEEAHRHQVLDIARVSPALGGHEGHNSTEDRREEEKDGAQEVIPGREDLVGSQQHQGDAAEHEHACPCSNRCSKLRAHIGQAVEAEEGRQGARASAHRHAAEGIVGGEVLGSLPDEPDVALTLHRMVHIRLQLRSTFRTPLEAPWVNRRLLPASPALLGACDDWHAQHLGGVHALKVRAIGPRSLHVGPRGDGEPHQLGEDPNLVGLGCHKGVEPEPQRQEEVRDAAANRQDPCSHHPRWSPGWDSPLAKAGGRAGELDGDDQKVHLHLLGNELHSVPHITAPEVNLLEAHLHKLVLHDRALSAVILEVRSVVAEELIGGACDAGD